MKERPSLDGLEHEHSGNSAFMGPTQFLTSPSPGTEKGAHGQGWAKTEGLIQRKGTEMVSAPASQAAASGS